MRLLIVTQKVDKNDPVLGFFHRWIEEFAQRFEKVTVICLEKGEFNLPGIKVLSLGKEEHASKAEYLSRFYKYIWSERNNYDVVFVHMNQEYVLLGWKLWKLMGKKIYLWRNHAEGNLFTRYAVMVSNKVFYTSPSSYTAKFRKSIQMPVGIDTEFFKSDPNMVRPTNTVLFIGRVSPVKKVLEFIDWANKEPYQVTIAGPIFPIDKEYGESVLRALNSKMKYIGAVNQEEARKLYQTHENYANFTPLGSFDKTIFEAAACETRIIVANEDLKLLENKSGSELRNYVIQNHSLNLLIEKLKSAFTT